MPHEPVECPRCGAMTRQFYTDEASLADPANTRCPLACGPCLGIPEPTGPRGVYVVAVYDVGLSYGGPEEGGWWYDAGSLVRVCRVFRSEDRAYAYCRRLNARLSSRVFGPNVGRYPKSSVLSDGQFEACTFEDTAPAGFPESRPYYC